VHRGVSIDSDGKDITLPWYAIHVRSNFEQMVHRALEQKGYEVFSPTYRVKRRWSDRMKDIDVPLFPGYIFCRLDQQHRLPIVTTPGVVQLVGNGKKPVAITEDEITAVKTVLKSNLPYMPWQSLVPGNRVVVDRGPLMGVQGVLLESRTGDRLVVSIDILNRAVAVEIDATWVQRPHVPGMAGFASEARIT
jgi:transcription antitermination factor NusG